MRLGLRAAIRHRARKAALPDTMTLRTLALVVIYGVCRTEDAGMPQIKLITTCQYCDEPYPKTSALKCLLHRYEIHCKICDCTTASELGWRAKIILNIYTQILTFLLGVPIVVGIAVGDWTLAFVSLLAFAILAISPAMFLHARKATRASQSA
jgi:hypothetical protein